VGFIADFHVHSPYSRATSRSCDLIGLWRWARAKGIHVIGTGDFTHPAWIRDVKRLLQPAEPGFWKLAKPPVEEALPGITPEDLDIRFVLTAEVSSIYKRHGKVRKVHNLLFVPDLESVSRVNGRLRRIGNIESDGRPILGLDSRDLLEVLLEEAPQGFLVPAHVWTPWFSLFGSKSGFDSVDECFGDLSHHVFALETGLSSDPDMNRRISALDRFTLISNSDCHSPQKLGREANRFRTEYSYFAIRDALKDPSRGFEGTLEFYPEGGKYHLDGHRKCETRLTPEETRARRGSCPVCGKPVTEGVAHRVFELADRDTPYYGPGATGYVSVIPLQEMLSEVVHVGPDSKTVAAEYARLVSSFGSELNVLLHAPVEDVHSKGWELLAEALKRMREGRVIRNAGYDGQYGTIRVFEDREIKRPGRL